MRFREVVVFLWLAIFAVSAQAQQSEFDVLPSPNHLTSALRFEHLSIEDGLSQSSVTKVHDGALEVSSGDGDGTTFTITLPTEPTA